MNPGHANSLGRCRQQPSHRLVWLLAGLLWLAGCQTAAPAATPTVSGPTAPSPTVAIITTVTETVACTLRGPSRLLAFSADGQYLAYGYQESTRSRLYLLNVGSTVGETGSAPKLLADDGWEFAWDPQGERLVYAGASGRTLTLLNVDGEKIGEINAGWQHASPAWSPDGTTIALLHTARRRDEAGLAASGLMWARLDDLGSPQMAFSLQQLGALNGGSQRFNSGPAWSPNSAEVAIVAADGLFRVGLAGAAPTRLTAADICAQHPLWSPDGGQIAFLAAPAFADPANGWGLQVMNADGGGLVTLAANGDLHLEQFAWSPDGGQIAFTASAAGTEANLYLINRDGSGLRQLAVPIAGPKYVAAWAPAGNGAAAALALVVGNEIGVIDLSSSSWARLGVLP